MSVSESVSLDMFDYQYGGVAIWGLLLSPLKTWGYMIIFLVSYSMFDSLDEPSGLC